MKQVKCFKIEMSRPWFNSDPTDLNDFLKRPDVRNPEIVVSPLVSVSAVLVTVIYEIEPGYRESGR